MNPPGNLTELGPQGLAAWSARLAAAVAEAEARVGDNPYLLPEPDDRTGEVTGPDWLGFPARVGACLGREQALGVLDHRTARGDRGRALLQEEYMEWRTVRNQNQKLVRVEITTELPDYWRVLAAYEPGKTLELVEQFAGQPLEAEEVYEGRDPFAEGMTAEEREQAFARAMLGSGTSRYNDGRAGICCMRQRSNDLGSLLELALAATTPCLVVDEVSGRQRCMTAREVIPRLQEAAQQGRNSDPVLVERLSRLAFEDRLVAFDDPCGVYIQSVEHERLQLPGGEPVPLECFHFSRGQDEAAAPDGRRRSQRLEAQVPDEVGLVLGDLVDRATEQPIRYGGQIADLVQLAVFLRVSPPGTAQQDTPSPSEVDQEQLGYDDCGEVRRIADQLMSGDPA